MLADFIYDLSRHRRRTMVLSAGYFLLMSLPHDLGQRLTLWSYERFGREAIDLLFFSLAAIVALVALAFFLKGIKRVSHRGGAVALSVLSLVLLAGCYRWLFYAPAELVHLPQYGVLAIPLYALTGSHLHTLCYVAGLATLDEAYQYWFIYNPKWPSLLDFNDVTFDLLGASMTCIGIHFSGAAGRIGPRAFNWKKSPIVWLAIGSVMLCIVLYGAGILGFYPGADGSERAIMLSRQSLEPYWRDTPTGKWYHVMPIWEALPVIAGIILVFCRMDRWARK